MRGTVTAGLAGATIGVEYSPGIWDGLTKTVVFRGSVTKDVVTNDTTIEIPWETLTEPGKRLQVGFYGVDDDGKQIIPTVWADLGRIQPGADPSGDPSTDPSLPVWGQIADRVEDIAKDVEELKQGGGPGTPGVPGTDGEDGGYYTPAVTQLDEDTIQFAFTPSKADMPAVEPVAVELPVGQGSGGNAVQYVPQELTDEQKAQARDNIGATTVEEVLAQIPGSGGETSEMLMDTITIEEDGVTSITRTLEHECTRILIKTTIKQASANANLRLTINRDTYIGAIANGISAKWDACSIYLLILDKPLGQIYSFMSQHTNSFGNSVQPDWTVKSMSRNIVHVDLYASSGELPNGSKIEIYGVRADA